MGNFALTSTPWMNITMFVLIVQQRLVWQNYFRDVVTCHSFATILSMSKNILHSFTNVVLVLLKS